MRSMCSARRVAFGVTVIATLVLSVPGPAAAATECGLLVCADATSTAGWRCEVHDFDGFGIGICFGSGSGTGGGHSDLAIPGSAAFGTSIACSFLTGGGPFGCGGSADGPNLCTWAGLGENACARTYGDEFGPFGFPLDPGHPCISDALAAGEIDVEITTTTFSDATKSLLILGPLDSASALDIVVAPLSALPDDASTCLPSAG